MEAAAVNAVSPNEASISSMPFERKNGNFFFFLLKLPIIASINRASDCIYRAAGINALNCGNGVCSEDLT